MQRDRLDVEKALKKKGFEQDDTHHHLFWYHTMEGKKTAIRTRTSHTGKIINNTLIGQMARQCKLTVSDFLDLVDCPLQRKDFEKRALIK